MRARARGLRTKGTPPKAPPLSSLLSSSRHRRALVLLTPRRLRVFALYTLDLCDRSHSNEVLMRLVESTAGVRSLF